MLAVFVAAVVLWRVDLARKHDCITSGKVHCTMLPWSGVNPSSLSTAKPGSEGFIEGVGTSVKGVGNGVSGSYSSSGAKVP